MLALRASIAGTSDASRLGGAIGGAILGVPLEWFRERKLTLSFYFH